MSFGEKMPIIDDRMYEELLEIKDHLDAVEQEGAKIRVEKQEIRIEDAR